MSDILSGLPAGSLEPQLRASIDMAEARKAQGAQPGPWAIEKLRDTVRRECAYALEPIASSILHPTISRVYLEGAIKSLQRALEAARELDPEEITL